jgi:hypothetical protein
VEREKQRRPVEEKGLRGTDKEKWQISRKRGRES